jgi:hypothetical protein
MGVWNGTVWLFDEILRAKFKILNKAQKEKFNKDWRQVIRAID